jgi:phosphonate transport system permease protein
VPATPSEFFRERNFRLRIFLVIALLLTLVSVWHTGFKTSTFFTAIPRVILWIAAHITPDAAAWARFPNIAEKLLDTVIMSLMASTSAAVLALFFAIMGARSTCINPYLATLSRAIASISRNIPIAAWAMIFLISFGMSSFTGYLALFFSSFGFLTRAFIETIEECADSQVEALRATGATYGHTLVHAVIPSSAPQLISWVLYMLETNIRDATLVGLLTGSGIGFLFDLYYKSQQYRSASLIVLTLVVIVIAIESLSNLIRRKIL